MDILLNYIGSKRTAIGRLSTYFPYNLANYEYREPMIDGGSVLIGLNKNGLKPDIISIGDINRVVYEIWYRALYHPKELILETRNTLNRLESLIGTECRLDYLNQYVDPIIKEVILNRVRQFGNYGNIDERKLNKVCEIGIDLDDRLINLHKTLKGSKIRLINNHYAWSLKEPSVDGRPVLVFLDPPYYKVYDRNGYYGDYHKNFDYMELLHLLRNTKHKFVMTLDNSLEMRELYKEFNCQLLPVKYSMNKKTVNELLITNF